MIKKYNRILVLAIILASAGALAGYLFFYFWQNPSLFIIDKFRVLQNFFGIRQYSQGMAPLYIFLIIFFGNLFSTLGYFGLGYLKTTLPMSFITGFFIIIFLFTGTIRHAQNIPGDVIFLVSVETAYRLMMLSYGEYFSFYKFKPRTLSITIISLSAGLFLLGVVWEMLSIYYW